MIFNLSATPIKKALTNFLHRFHVLIFVIIVLGGLVGIIFLLNAVIVKSSDNNGYTPSTNSAAFDQDTMKKIKDLKTRDQTGDQLDLSHGRTNPFVE